MNAVEILGSLLGGKAGSSGSGGNILKDLVGSVFKGKPQSQAQSQSRFPGPSSPPKGGGGGSDLQDMLRSALNKFQQRKGGGKQDPSCNDPSHGASSSGASELDNAQAVVLIRAMVNAAKSDGKLDRTEQESIVSRLGTVTQDELDFLKKEFAAPLDVREFSWSVPLGLEQQVYGLSLMAINLDQDKEAKYLKDLAHGLRLAPDTCNRIHKQYNAPVLYR